MVIGVHEWSLELLSSSRAVTYNAHLPEPMGFVSKTSTSKKRESKNGVGKSTATSLKSNPEQLAELQVRKAWEIAIEPAKSIPLNLIMSYMSGSSLQLIPIMTALMLLSGPLKAVFNTREVFKSVSGNQETASQVRLAIVVYCLVQGVLMYIGMRKLNSMGLIPNTRSDWVDWERINYFNNGLRSYAF